VSYSIGLETFKATYPEVERLYRMHYAAMQERLAGEGVAIGPYNPRLDQYELASDGGWLLTFIVRFDGKAVGYSNVYLTSDMHNNELIAMEDTIFVEPDHRNGIGRKLTLFVLDDLRARGVKRAMVTTATDKRVGNLLRRLGFKHTAEAMTFIF
jgi:GNAT superfamily N-acetyltransferase